MKMRDITEIDIPRYVWDSQKAYTDKRDVYGFDTETVEGYARLITVSNGEYFFVNSFRDCAEFLLQRRFNKGLNFFFNLRYDYTAILKWLPEDVLRELVKNQVVFYEGYRIKFIEKKFFQLSKGAKYNHSTSFYDIAQFFKGSLKKCALIVNEEKIDYDVGEMTEEKLNDPLLLKYGIHDAYITGKLAEYFRSQVSKITSVRQYYSCASIAKRYVLTTKRKTFFPNDPMLLDMALKSYQGGRFEVMQRGFFNKLYCNDINSAYPEQIANLDSCEGVVKRNKEYEPSSVHSFFKCTVEIYNVMMSPMKWQTEGGLMVYPAGEFNNVYLTKQEYELIDELGFPIQIKEAVHIFNKEPTKPFADFYELYQTRSELKEAGNDLQMVYKTIMNSTYGCMIQGIKKDKPVGFPTKYFKYENGEVQFYDRRYRAGSLFNPIWASEITARTRVKMFRDFHKYGNHIVSIATDGVMLTKKAHVKVGNKLGEYDYEQDEGIVLGSGVYHTKNKTRFRGFGRKMDLFDVLNSNLQKTLIPFERTRPRNIKESLNQESLGFESINLFLKEERTLDLNFDKKRRWVRRFDSARDCLNNRIPSAPLVVES